MASILRSSKFVRYFAGFARNLVFSTARETESSFVQQSQCLCGNFTSGFATAATKSKSGLDRSLKRLDDDVRRSGRISRRDLEEVLEEIRINRSATSAQSLLVIRCCGNLVPEELPEVRTALVQEIWKTLKNLNVAMDVSHYNALLRVFLDNEHPFSPTEFLADMQSQGIEPNRVTFQRLISRYCQQGDIEGATRILEFMREKQLPVNEYVFNALIMGHSQADDLESATGILAVMAQAGLQPSADTYTTLLCGYARKGDIEYICKTMDTCEQNEIFLLDKDILEVMYALATNGHPEKVDRLVEKIRRQAGYNQDAVNVILRLINRGQEEVGMKLLRTMPRASRNDGELANTGSFLIRQLVRAKRPSEKVIAICKELHDSGMNDRAHLIALETALKGGSVELTFALLEELVRQQQPIRQHYFWPLMCANEPTATKEERTDSVLYVLRAMVEKFGLYPSSETVREYAVPNLPVSNSEIVIQLLRSAGISPAVASSSCAYVALERNHLKEAANIASRYRAYYAPGVYRKPLVQALVQTRDYDAYVRFSRAIYDGLKRSRSVEEESDQGGAESEQNGNSIETLQAETIGALIFDAVTNFKADRVEMMQRILTGFVNQGLSISNGMAERIQERMGSEMTEEISSMLSKLAAGDLEPIEVERTPNGSGRQGRPPIASLSVPQLERLVADLEARKENANSVKSQLIRSVIRSNDLAKTKEVLQKLEAENYIISPGVYGMVIELHATNGKVDEAFELLKTVKAKQPDFTLDRVKVVRLAQSLLEGERFDDALQFLQENAAAAAIEPPAIKDQQGDSQRGEVDFVYNSACWRLLNILAERGNVQQVTQLFDHLIAQGYIKPQTNFLGSLIKVHLVRDDLPTAMTTFADICQKYRMTPWKTELTCRLIQAEDASNLQRLTDLSTEVHGEVNSLYDLVFAFVDCGRIRQARKILETPGLRTRYQRIQTACERYQQEGKTASLEGLMEATKDLNHIDRSEIYHKLLQSYIGEKDADKALGLWTRMQEESVAPSDAFLTELGDFLKSNGYDVPFAVPVQAVVKTAKGNKQATSTTASKGSSPAPETSRAKRPQVTSSLRELKQAIKANNPDRILAAYEALNGATSPKPNLTEQSAIIEALVNRDRLAEASKLVLSLLEQQLFPVPRTFKYFLNKLAISGDVATFDRIGALITDDLKRQISFDNRLCHANVSNGNADQYLHKLEAAIEQAKSKEDATVAAKHFPIGGASGILSQHPELHERYEQLAERYAKWGLLAPVNALWIHYFISGATEKAQSIWDRHLKDSSRIMFQKIIQQARDAKDDELCRRLIAKLHDSKVTEKGKGLIYSCLVDILVAKERPDDALAALEEGLKVTCLENVNRTALKRLQESLAAKGKSFPHAIPARNAKAAHEPSSTSSSDSDSESSSDEEPTKKAAAAAGTASSKPISKNLSMIRIGQLVVRNAQKVKGIEIRRCLSAAPQAKQAEAAPAQSDADKRPNMSFLTNIFRGQVQPEQVFPYPEALDAEQKEYIAAFVDPVTKFFEEVNDPVKNDVNAQIDEKTTEALWELGAFSLMVPPEYGGLGLNNTQYSRMCDIIGGQDLGLGIFIGAHQSIGFKGILLYGDKRQKEKYLPMVSTGKTYAAFALTEPSSGSDAGSIRCRAVKSADGKHYVLNGSKIWISNGGIADVMTVFAQTEQEDPKTGQKKDKVTAFIVERGFGGVSSGPPENKMGIKCSNTAEVYFEDVKIPIENVLGGEGNGFKVAMNILNNGRFGMAATLSGTMRACIQKAAEHATNRVQFGRKIETYGGIQEKLARMAMHHYVTQSMAYMISGNMDTGSQDYHLEAAISKVFASESAWYVCDEAIQILGGMGFMKDCGLERVMRDLRIFRIFEGTNDILRLFVALTGIQYAGSHLKELQRAFKNPATNMGLIFKEGSRRAIRSIGYGGTDLSTHVAEPLKHSAKQCSECIDLFGQTVESLLIKYGKKIVDEQFLLNRLADAAIDTYAMAVALSRASRSVRKDLPSAEHEVLMTKAWCHEASDRVRVNIRKINTNSFVQNNGVMSQISKNICANNGIAHNNPLDIETIARGAATTSTTQDKPRTNRSFLMNLFGGKLQTAELFPYPEPLDAEQKEYARALVDPVHKFFTEVNDAARNDDTSNVDKRTIDALWDLGLLSVYVPPELGGLGLCNVQSVLMAEISGSYDLALSLLIGAHKSIGTKGILLFGSEQQKQKYLPMLSSGRVFGAFALTEPGTGSDAASIKTKAVLSPCGAYYILNGSKLWISGGGLSDIFTTFAQVEVTDAQTGEKRNKMTAFIVERSFGGVSTGPPEDKMGLKCSSTNELFLDDVKVPVANVLGEVGNGFKIAVNILNSGRYGLGAMLSGTMKTCIETAANHVSDRVQFKRKLIEFENVQEKLALMATHHYVAQSLTYMVSGNMDKGSVDFHLEAAVSKVFCTEAAWYVCDEAIQLLGGNGFMKSSGLERFLRDIRVYRIFEGANDVLRMFIALTGIQHAGRDLRELQKALKSPLGNMGVLFAQGTKRVGRSVGTGGTDLSPFVASELQNAAKQCAERIQEHFYVSDLEFETAELFPYPEPLNEEQREYIQAFIDPTVKFYEEVNDAARNDATASVEKTVVDALWDQGYLGPFIPTEYGGLGLSNAQSVRLSEISGSYDLGMSIYAGAHQTIGTKGILLYGTKEQKEKYLPQLCTGRVFGAFALTEPGTGSDAASVKTKAVLSPCGKYYILNGSKLWCSGGGIANIFTTFAQTEVTDPSTGEKRSKMSAFIVERAFAGVSTGPPEDKMGIKCSVTTEVFFDDAKVPVENLLGEVGNGFKIAVNILNSGRFGLGAMLSGTMKTCVEKAANHVSDRVQFKRKLVEFENVQEKLALMATHHYVAQSLTYMVAGNMDKGSVDFHLEAAVSKVFCTEAAWYVCDEAIQLLGGNGFMKSSGLERFLRDMRIFRIFEGANDVLRMFIALTGIQKAGKDLRELQKALKNPLGNMGVIFAEGTKRAGRSVGVGGTDLRSFVTSELQHSAKQCAESMDMFSRTIESLLVKHGKGIVERQFQLARVADCAIDIYTMAAVLSRASRAVRKGLPSARQELLMTQIWCQEASVRVQRNISRIHSGIYQQHYAKLAQVARNVMLRLGHYVVARNEPSSKAILQQYCRWLSATAQSKPKERSNPAPTVNTSYMANLFRGEIEPLQVFPYPDALKPEQKELVGSLVDPVTRFFESHDPVKAEKNGGPDEATFQSMWEMGLMGMQAPEEYGGLALPNTGYARMGELLGAVDLGLAVVFGAHQSIGWKGVLLYGTEEQKRKYIPQVASGGTIAAFCLTEPSSGSDAGSIRSRAVKSADGKHYVLNGSKIWISNGGLANLLTVFAQTEVTDERTGKKRDKVTAFIVERAFGGVTSGPAEDKMGIKCSNTTEVYFDDVKIPVENVLGKEGDGFKVAMNILNNGRFGMAGTLAGTMGECIRKAAEHATSRVQFGQKIENFGNVQEKLARMAMLQYVSQSMGYMIAGNMDAGHSDYHLEAAISKVFASEAAWYVCDEAIQILGGNGFMTASGLEKFLRDIRIYRIFEGANDILRLFVTLTGIQYAGSHLKELQRAFKNPTANLGLIFKEGSRRAVRSIGYGGTDLSTFVADPLKESAALCADSIDRFSKTIEALLIKHGKGIVDQQFLLIRLADSAIDIYAMSCVLSRATKAVRANLPSAEHEVLMAKAWCVEANDRVRINIRRASNGVFLKNYDTMSAIAKNICAQQGVVQTNPVGIA
uniref:Very long-chain specific acyl-CoA dehydrogenase, mitochondrial n=1 Tax=Anopheles dirus TaxID=7168 RepID=A0A182NB72_9DIPT